MQIRMATNADVDSIYKLMQDAVGSYNKDYYTLTGRDYFEEMIDLCGITLIAEDKGKVVAYAMLAFSVEYDRNKILALGIPESELGLVAALDACVVLESARGNRLQERFILKRELIAREEGKKHLYVSVHPDNSYSLNNMLKQGFEIRLESTNNSGKPRYYLYKSLDTAV